MGSVGSVFIMVDVNTAGSFGPNEWLVEEMYDRYKADPASVGPSWQEFFANYRQTTAPPRSAAAAPAPAVVPSETPEAAPPTEKPKPAAADGDVPLPIKGVAARIVANMEASLAVPTATSVRRGPGQAPRGQPGDPQQPAGPPRGGKVSFTHLIGFAVVRALRGRARS